MSSIDERIVEMKFNNGQFEQGVKKTRDSLDALKKGLDLKGAAAGLDNLNAAGSRFSLAGIAAGVAGIGQKFTAMGIVGVTALATIAHQAVATGIQMGKSLTVDPIMQGFSEYELKMGSIQTILANTARHGTKLKEVTANLDELNEYADKTIYNFGAMTKNIGLFTNAGIKVGDATSMIKGFSNEAAASGTSAEGAAGAAYQLSQALSAGTIRLMDWRSLQNVGMGNKNMQNGLIEMADAMGVLNEKGVSATEIQSNFNGSLEKNWLSADVMSNYLKIMAGDLTAAEQASLGLSDAQIKAFAKQQKMAEEAATKVRTYTQLVGTLQEAVGSSWAETFDILVGDFEEATDMWTKVNDRLGGMIGAAGDARNKMLTGWDELGGRDVAIEAISTAFDALMDVIDVVRDAWNDIFPPATAKDLYNITVMIRDFAKTLKMGEEESENLKRTLRGVFAVFDIIGMVISGVFSVFGKLFGTIQSGSGSILNFTGNLGDFLVSLRDAIKNGNGLTRFFEGLGTVLSLPIKAIQAVVGWIGKLTDDIEGFDSGPVGDSMNVMERGAQRVAGVGEFLLSIWRNLQIAFQKTMQFMQPVIKSMSDFFSGLGQAIADGFSTGNFDRVLDLVNTGLFGGLVLLIKKFTDNALGFNFNFFSGNGEGILDSIKDSFSALTGSLEAMQAKLKADALLRIAAAIGIMALAVIGLSLVDSGKLAGALGAMGAMFGELLLAMMLFEKASSMWGALKMQVIAVGLILLAGAIAILSTAVVNMARLDWNGLAKGLVGTIGLVGALVAMAQLMPANLPGKMIAFGLGMIPMATGIKILASAVGDLAGYSWEALAKGVAGVAALMATVAGFSHIVSPAKIVPAGLALVVLGAGLKVMASALGDFVQYDNETLARGLLAMAGGLLAVAAGMQAMPANMLLTAPALIIVAYALGILADTFGKMAGMSWDDIGRVATIVAGALLIIAGGMYLMTGALPGAAALIVVAGALHVLADVFPKLAELSWDDVGKIMGTLASLLGILAVGLTLMLVALPGALALQVVTTALAGLVPVLIQLGSVGWDVIGPALGMLAATLGIIAAAGILLIPALPGLFGLGAALLLIGGGVLMAGVGTAAFAVALTALSVAVGVSGGVIVAFVASMIALIPQAMEALARGILAFAAVIATGGPQLTAAFTTVILSLIAAITTNTPKIISMLLKMLLGLLNALVNYVPRMVDAGMKLITGILNGIAKNIGQLVDAATNVITKFLDGIARNIPKIIQSGVNLVIKFVEGLADGIRNNSERMGRAGGDLAVAIIDGIIGGLGAGVGRVVEAAQNVASNILGAVGNFLGIASPSKEFIKVGKYIIDGLVKGLHGSAPAVKEAYNQMRTLLKEAYAAANEDVKIQEERLAKLNKARNKDTAAIKKTQAALAQARKEVKATRNAYDYLTKSLDDEQKKLYGLAKSHDKVLEKLDAANKKLADAKKTRDDFRVSTKERFADLESITADTKLEDYFTNLQKRIADTRTFAEKLQQLRDLGLHDELYKELLQAGPDSIPFLDDILSRGPEQVKDLNGLVHELRVVSGELGKSASSELYQAAVDSAQGLVDGLKKQEAAIAKQMDKIADYMVAAIKKKLGIKSPSRVFRGIGDDSGKGLVNGLRASAGAVGKASEGVGNTALMTLKKSMANISKVVATDMDMNPHIRPVLDLSQVRREAGNLDGMFSAPKLTTDMAYSRAASVADERRTEQERMYAERDEYASARAGDTYVQNNYSPKALSAAEIYRNTKNQLSKKRGALTTPNADQR